MTAAEFSGVRVENFVANVEKFEVAVEKFEVAVDFFVVPSGKLFSHKGIFADESFESLEREKGARLRAGANASRAARPWAKNSAGMQKRVFSTFCIVAAPALQAPQHRPCV